MFLYNIFSRWGFHDQRGHSFAYLLFIFELLSTVISFGTCRYIPAPWNHSALPLQLVTQSPQCLLRLSEIRVSVVELVSYLYIYISIYTSHIFRSCWSRWIHGFSVEWLKPASLRLYSCFWEQPSFVGHVRTMELLMLSTSWPLNEATSRKHNSGFNCYLPGTTRLANRTSPKCHPGN